MKKRVIAGVWALSIVSVCILGSCNTSRQAEESETAENMENTSIPADTASIMNMDNNNNNNMGTDSIRAVE